jgi:hypothetical protein
MSHSPNRRAPARGLHIPVGPARVLVVIIIVLAVFPLLAASAGFAPAEAVAMLLALVAAVGHLTYRRMPAR